MTKDNGLMSPLGSPLDDQFKSKRGRKPSQAKLAMLESKRLFADKRRFPDSDNGEGNTKKSKKKKIISDKNKKNANDDMKLKKKKLAGKGKQNSFDNGKNGKKNDGQGRNDERRKRRKAPSRYRTESSDDTNTSDDEFWESKKSGRKGYDDRDDLFFDSDTEDEFDNELLQNSDEDTEDASETDMATLEEEISEMKEQMYQEKIKELKGKLTELQNKTLPEFVIQLEELKKQKEDWIRTAYAYKTYEEREIEREYEREKRLTKEDFEQKKSELKEVLVTELTEKKKLIENEKSTLELSGGVGPLLPMEVKPVVTRKLRRRPNDPPPVTEKKRKTVSTPLNLLLSEDQVLVDMKKINKHYKPPEDRNTPSKNNKNDKCDPLTFPDGSDAKLKDEKLYYNKEWYQSGDPVYLNSKDGERFNAQIHSITKTKEIWIKKLTEGTRLKIYVGHLQRGKYSIERREKK